MARQEFSRDIGANTYKTTQLGALQGRKVLARLESAGGKATEELSEYLYDTFAAVSSVRVGEGKWPQLDKIFDTHFCGNYAEMGSWLAFCIEVNFQNFGTTSVTESP